METDTQNDDELARFTALGARVLRPERARLGEALEVVTGIAPELVRAALGSASWTWSNDRSHNALSWRELDAGGKPYSAIARSPRDRLVDPREAWEMLAARGVIPDDWVDSRDRRFFNGFKGAAPPTVGAAVTLASDPEGVVAVEALARELAQRLALWLGGDGARREPRVLWRVDGPWGAIGWRASAIGGGAAVQQLVQMCSVVLPPSPPRERTRGGPGRVRERAWPAFDVMGSAVVEGAGRRDGPVYTVAVLAMAAARWRAAAAAGESRLAGPGLGRIEMARQPDPFEPLLAIWGRGYALADLTAKTITLVASEVGERW